MAKKRALITGITGQDGSYLAEFLLAQSYEVIGMLRRSSTLNFHRIEHIQDQLTLVSGDLMDQISLIRLLEAHRPHEIYNLAAQSFVPASWKQPADYVLSTGRAHTVQRFVELAFQAVDLDWRGYVVQDPCFMRPADVDLLVGDPTRARADLDWEATTSLEELVRIMVQAELKVI